MENNMYNFVQEQEQEQTVQTAVAGEKKSKVEQAKEELKLLNKEIKVIKEEIKKLNIIEEKSDENEDKLKQLKKQMAELTIKKAGLKKITNAARTKEQIRKSKIYLANAKYEDIKTNLEKNNIYSENAVKTLIKIKLLLNKYNVKNINQMEQILAYAKQTASNLFETEN